MKTVILSFMVDIQDTMYGFHLRQSCVISLA